MLENFLQNVTTTSSLTSLTERGLISAFTTWRMQLCLWAGTDSEEKLETKWQIPVLTYCIVVRLCQDGLMENTLQCLMGLFNAKFVLMEEEATVVIIQLTLVFVTVGHFTFTNLRHSMFLSYVTVATDMYHQHQVGGFSYILFCSSRH